MTTKPRLRTKEQEQAAFKYLRPSFIAEKLDCEHEHVLNLIRAKKLEAVDIGSGKRPEYRIAPDEFERFLRERTV